MRKLPIHFIYSTNVDERIFKITDVDKHWYEFKSGQQIWIFQTYCLLKKYYPNVTLGSEPKKGSINIIHAGNFGRTNNITDYYVLSIRADYERLLWANYEIVQNKLQVKRETAYITHWPQPGLIKRKNSKSKVENVAYLGNPEQNEVRNYPIEQDLRSMGMTYSVMGRKNWNDYSNIDIALAIRRFSDHDRANNKPPTKLINAWLAEVPLIASNDSAYSQIAVPGEDYIVVSSYDEMMEKIRFLKDNPEYYKKIVKNGIRKREHYTRECIINEWIEVFEHQIFPDFAEWERKRGVKRDIEKVTRKTLRFYQRAILKVKDVFKR